MNIPILQMNKMRDKEVRCMSKVTQLKSDKACDQTPGLNEPRVRVPASVTASTVGLGVWYDQC